jgi:hypothetical protein
VECCILKKEKKMTRIISNLFIMISLLLSTNNPVFGAHILEPLGLEIAATPPRGRVFGGIVYSNNSKDIAEGEKVAEDALSLEFEVGVGENTQLHFEAGIIIAEEHGHEIVGEVTPLMMSMNHALAFIEAGKGEGAIRIAEGIYEDFHPPMSGMNHMSGKEPGLKTTSERIDKRFGTKTLSSLADAILGRDPERLKAGMEWISFLLMLEKFDLLQTMKHANRETQIMVFWLCRNYFSYLLEPAIARTNPMEEKRLDRLLDKMLYRLEDGEVAAFIQLREELIDSIIRLNRFPMPERLRLEKADESSPLSKGD